MSKSLRIVFLGTPDFAVESLEALYRSDHEVVGVITMPDKPAGRGHKLKASPVKQFALDNAIPVLQPKNLKDEDFIKDLKALKADLQVVVAFRMLPEVVWNMPPMGTINVHASLLPQYRGAAPINWAVMNGEKYSGVTTFLLKHEIDTGNILLQKEVAITPEDNAGSLHDKLMKAGAKLLIETVDRYNENNLEPTPQSEVKIEGEPRKAPKIFKSDCRIDWSQDGETIHNKIRGLSPYPTAWTKISGVSDKEKTLKLYWSEPADDHEKLAPGRVLTENDQFIVGTGSIPILLKELQMEGKKRMKANDFLRGLHDKENLKLN
jgi:methionyl-tRNA formyltransferase